MLADGGDKPSGLSATLSIAVVYPLYGHLELPKQGFLLSIGEEPQN
jgi:hypothetical protein